MKSMIKYAAATAAFALLVGNATAATMLDWQDGSAGREYTGWSDSVLWNPNFPQPGTMAFDTGVGNGGVSMNGRDAIQITADTVGFGVEASVFSTTAFAGDMTDYQGSGAVVAGMAFDFYSAGDAPSGLGLYFQSAFGGGSVWYYDITPIAGNDWNTYGAAFGSGAGWYGYEDNTWAVSMDSADFADALTDVTAHGMFVFFNPNQAGQEYGLNDFGLTVPEPGTYVVLGMALLSVAFIFRKRITVSLAEARAMMQM